ncbi:PucR family transcriptional regulator [Microbacterium sp. ASV49]|uniref:PucR family transcriptional regulator n=1 Tax=Microbacterium candidum TaxID=3041922 RepID=A0ABT7N3T4_9MICO|nr:PucR family transcriptional regulator [Microbacterium sp. ASV49]MDL9981328.1 PucR family transcriptional regulator [Microbacterium sp. ASV49]
MVADPAPIPTLESLLARRELGLRLVENGDPDAASRPVRWVHSSDLVDPTPFLADDLVLLTTGTQFASDEPELYDDYVRRAVSRGVIALGFGTEVVREGVPAGLVAACRTHRMPLFEVPYKTPFIAVARANAEAVAAQAYARRSWALDAQRAIALAALRPDGLGATLVELAKQLHTWVGLFDASGKLTREHPVGGLDASSLALAAAEAGTLLRRGSRAAAALHEGAVPLTLQTLGRTGHLRGVIAIAAGELDPEGRGVLTAVVAMAGLALEQNRGLARAMTALRSALIQSLLTDEPTLARRIARDLTGGLPSAPVVVAVADVHRTDALDEWLEVQSAERRSDLAFGWHDHELVLVAPASADVAVALAERFGARVGVSSAAHYSGFSAAHAEAVTALRRGGDAVTTFAEVQASGMLAILDSVEARALAAGMLEPLIRSDAEDGTALIETVRVWLESDTRIEAAATALGVHRHTVRARIALAQRLLGIDLSTFAARAELWAAMQVAD